MNLVIAGDFNRNQQGMELLNRQLNLVIHVPPLPTRTGANGASTLDYFLSNMTCIDQQVQTGPTSSDHKLVDGHFSLVTKSAKPTLEMSHIKVLKKNTHLLQIQ